MGNKRRRPRGAPGSSGRVLRLGRNGAWPGERFRPRLLSSAGHRGRFRRRPADRRLRHRPDHRDLSYGLKNRKPTIAQWSVFLPRLGRRSPAGEPPYSLTAEALVAPPRDFRPLGGSGSAPRRPPGGQVLPLRVADRPLAGGGLTPDPPGWGWGHRMGDCGPG